MGFIIIYQIKAILEDGYFGRHYFKAAVMLRSSLFISSVLLKCEVWLNLTKRDIQKLVTVDSILNP